MESPKNILICPLDWGLGHVTRCIPIIQKLYNHKQQVYIACTKPQYHFIQEEFPQLIWIPCASINIHYSTNALTSLDLIKLVPKILYGIKRDQCNIEKWIHKYSIDLIISDSRFGCFSKKVPSIIITHQIKLELPKVFKWAEKIVFNRIKKYIRHFDRCWIPDTNDMPNFAGELTSKYSLNGKSVFVGILSRFDAFTFTEKPKEYTYEIIGIVSGPEPQRTLFADILLSQMKQIKKPCLLVLGKVDDTKKTENEGMVTVYNYLNSEELYYAIQSSRYIIARSGYSTIMDLISLRRLAILVPTPGQTEQEYLAQYYDQRKMFVVVHQNELQLQDAISQLSVYQLFYHYEPSHIIDNELESLIGNAPSALKIN